MGKSSGALILSIVAWAFMFVSCNDKKPVPKPLCYLRTDFPEHTYTTTVIKHPCFAYQFDLGNSYSVENYFLNQERSFFYFNQRLITKFNARQIIDLGTLDGRLELYSFLLPSRDSLNSLINFSNDLVDEEKIKADSIKFTRYLESERRVFGTFYQIHGNAAINFRFHLTDSSKRFVLGFVMLNCRPNYDSLRPTLDYLKVDLDRMMQSFQWKK